MRHLQHMVARGEAAGIQVDALLDDAGLPRSALVNADAAVPLTAIESMLAVLSQRYADPLPGLHLASDIQPATFGVIGFISQACTTLSDVLDVAVRYNGLLSNIGKVSVNHRPGLVEVNWECLAGGPAFRRHASEYVLGAFTVLARLLLPQGALPASGSIVQSVHFTHARPEDPERVREYFEFFRCPVHFGRPATALVIPVNLLKARLRHGDAFMKELLERHAQDQLRQREQGASLADNVRHLVAAMSIDGMPGKEAIAQQLGMSSRSLHRKLQDAGTSFREILDAVRLATAHQRLTGSRDTVNAIADELGFSSHQAFLRWFRKNTGQTPGEYRRRGKEKQS